MLLVDRRRGALCFQGAVRHQLWLAYPSDGVTLHRGRQTPDSRRVYQATATEHSQVDHLDGRGTMSEEDATERRQWPEL
jgi:hypothetical protein